MCVCGRPGEPAHRGAELTAVWRARASAVPWLVAAVVLVAAAIAGSLLLKA